MINKEVQNFLKEFHGEEATNFKFIKGKNIKELNSQYNDNAQAVIEQLNGQDYEVYFVPNSGGYKDQHITKFNCVFIDLDCGKDENKNYFPKDTVDEYKRLKLGELNQFQYKPGYIVETRNGLHAYWLLEGGVTAEQFSECEERLISYFNGDRAVKNPARLLRLPNFYWCKDSINRFMVKIIHQNKGSYEINSLIDTLPEVSQSEKCDSNRKKCTKLLSTDGTKSIYANRGDNLTLLSQKNVEALQSVINPKGTKLGSHDEVYDYLKKQDLQELLGIHGKTFSCLFHEDKNPSAGIITRNRASNLQLYE